MSAHILVVEDEPAIRELVAVNLRHAGYRVDGVDSAEAARTAIAHALPDLIVLDWMLPGEAGVDLLKALRADTRTGKVPIVLLTARAHEGDKLLGFERGADDYVTKPFSTRELVARVRAVLRRTGPGAKGSSGAEDEAPIEIEGLRLEPAAIRVSAGDARLSLSPTEFRLLHFLMRNADRAVSRDRLLDEVWGDRVYIDQRTVDVHIRRLRLALAPSGHDRLIETVRGEGYRFARS
ncbi:MAG: phosphate regulon transcriptional regulator PhoB [Burkholderiaceae bacterium]|nr:phosphate regulon transcriptional regulator PhoB [Burkholderiaceae bacterium]